MTVTGLGYRPVEYAAMGKEWKRRGKVLDEALEVMAHRLEGRTLRATTARWCRCWPMPHTRPHPMVLVGGSSPAAARRAARLGLPMQLPGQFPEIEALYYAECERHGTQGFCIAPDNVVMLNVAEDPDRVWAEHGECFMLEAMTYQGLAASRPDLGGLLQGDHRRGVAGRGHLPGAHPGGSDRLGPQHRRAGPASPGRRLAHRRSLVQRPARG